MRTFIGPDIILSDLTEGPTLFAQSASATQSASHVPHVMLRQPTLIHLVGPL